MQVVLTTPHPSAEEVAPIGTHASQSDISIVYLGAVYLLFFNVRCLIIYFYQNIFIFNIQMLVMIILNNMQVVLTAPQPSARPTGPNVHHSRQSNVRLYYVSIVCTDFNSIG
jgi:hypothetical protein